MSHPLNGLHVSDPTWMSCRIWVYPSRRSATSTWRSEKNWRKVESNSIWVVEEDPPQYQKRVVVNIVIEIVAWVHSLIGCHRPLGHLDPFLHLHSHLHYCAPLTHHLPHLPLLGKSPLKQSPYHDSNSSYWLWWCRPHREKQRGFVLWWVYLFSPPFVSIMVL